jgi:hypothetical protein
LLNLADTVERAALPVRKSSQYNKLGSMLYFTNTEANGAFKADIWPDLKANIVISKIGYKTENTHIEPLGRKGKVHLEFKLERQN